jgi:hypothetical protein
MRRPAQAAVPGVLGVRIQDELTSDQAWLNASFCGALANSAPSRAERQLYRTLNNSWVRIAMRLSPRRHDPYGDRNRPGAS